MEKPTYPCGCTILEAGKTYQLWMPDGPVFGRASLGVYTGKSFTLQYLDMIELRLFNVKGTERLVMDMHIIDIASNKHIACAKCISESMSVLEHLAEKSEHVLDQVEFCE